MRYSLTSGLVFSLGIAAILGTASAMAEPVPLPAVDFQVKARTMGKGEMTLHHQAAGKTRVEMQMPSMPEIVGIIDLKTRKMLMIGAIPGMSSMAIEVRLGHGAHYGQVIGNGHRVGTATVAGESCDLWQMDEAKDGKHGGQVTVCLARDNIPLRTEVVTDGKKRVVMEATEVERVPQDPSLFVVPANVQVMKMPKGMGGLSAIPGLSGE
jgi:hypothetical protein